MNNLTLRTEVSYLALAVCIPTDLDPEEAFDQVCPDKGSHQRVLARRKAAQTAEMIRLREQGMYYKDIAVMFGIHESTVYARIRQYKKQAANKGGEVIVKAQAQ